MTPEIQEFRLPATKTPPLTTVEAESLARHAYTLIGAEYYDESHITCRNFDQTVDAFLGECPLALKPGERYLEVGCGLSRLSMYSQPDVQVFLLDISAAMMANSISRGIGLSCALLGSAFALPFRNQSFTAIFGFLVDPFLHGSFFQELRRTLRHGGKILQVVPSHVWGSTLRDSRQSPAHFSHFFRGGREAFGPSFLVPDDDLIDIARSAGFGDVRLRTLFLPASISPERISPDILVPARLLGLNPRNLPLLTVIEATAI